MKRRKAERFEFKENSRDRTVGYEANVLIRAPVVMLMDTSSVPVAFVPTHA